MKDNREFIDGVYKKYDEYLKENKSEDFKQVKNTSNNKNFMNGKFVKILSATAVFAIVISGAYFTQNMINDKENQGNGGNEKNQNNNGTNVVTVGKTATTDKISLKTIDNFENFYNIVKENYKETNRNYSLDDGLDYVLEEATKDSASSANTETKTAEQSVNTSSETSDYSKTNTQVANVDEADIVKTNGKYIFYIVSNKLVIVDIQNGGKMEKIAEIDYKNDGLNPAELYVNENKVIVLGNQQKYTRGTTVKETLNNVYKKGIYRERTVAITYDITNIKEPKEERRVEIEGRYVSSRMIGNNVYFISNKSMYYNDIIKKELKDLDETAYQPTYVDTATSTEEKNIDFKSIYYFNNIETLNYLTLGGFTINSKDGADVKTFLGAGEDVYSSTENMYIIRTKNVYDADTHRSFGKDTKILKFNLNNGKIEFKAEADIEGGINNQFSMDEKDGYFRIATTIGRTYNMDNSTSNSLYILDKDLKEVGRLDGIAKAEKIYSVRYVGDKAYVVTFKTVDPLFVIDLSDVKNPKILGELKIPGYSTYLHPYDETHLIGFGYDTEDNGYGGVRNNGLKMSMFDVSDLNNPKELFNVKIGDSGTSSPLTTNHKALLFSKEKNMIAFPITTYKNGREYKAQVYDIDLTKGFTLRGEIEHKNESNDKGYSTIYKLNIDRILYSNNIFYTVSKKLIKATDMGTLQEISKLDLE